MEQIRAFVDGDIAAVTRVHRHAFMPAPGARPPSDTEYDEYWRDVFLSSPRRAEGIGSLVCEHEGAVVGFLGLLPRRMRTRDHCLMAAVATQFCVEPSHRGLAGLKLLRFALDGPQDLTLTDEASGHTRSLWTWAGGDTAIAGSLTWTRVMRPTRYASAWLRQRGRATASRLLRPLAMVADRVLMRVVPPTASAPPAGTVREELTVETIMARWPDLSADRDLAPVYDPSLLTWSLRRIRRHTWRGPLRTLMVRRRDDVLGWFIYHAPPGGIGEVLQVAAEARFAAAVWAHLLADASAQRVAALSGRVDPVMLPDAPDPWCLVARRGPWMLVHARQRRWLAPFHNGTAFYSRLDGEWCARLT